MSQDPVTAAKRLLGATLMANGMRCRIIETEAYCGRTDPGCHAFTGKTPRTEVLFGPPGVSYVYFTYGNHWMFNVVVAPDGFPAAVLVRAAIPMEGEERMWGNRPKAKTRYDLLRGPGKIAAAMEIVGQMNGLPVFESRSPVQVQLSDEPVHEFLVGTRIGLALGKGDRFPWRFIEAASWEWASRPRLKPAL